MRRVIYRFQFGKRIPLEDVEATFLLAVLAAESLHGEPQVRLEASHAMDREKRSIVVDATTMIGQNVNRLFVGFLNREFGPDAFQVERIERLYRSATAERN